MKTFNYSKSINNNFKKNLIKRLSFTNNIPNSLNIDNNNINNNNPNNHNTDNDKSNLPFSKINEIKINDYSKYSRTSKEFNFKSRYIKKALFPYKYYLCSIFIHNFDESKKSFLFTQKFIAVYNFICQLYDISSYLVLQREFQIMKNNLMVEEHKDILEKGQKINVNDKFFNIDMKECLNSLKFSILGKVK